MRTTLNTVIARSACATRQSIAHSKHWIAALRSVARNDVLVLLGIYLLLPSLAVAENPWKVLYNQQAPHKTVAAQRAVLDKTMPSELPTVRDALSNARQQTGLEHRITYSDAEKRIATLLQQEGAGESIKVDILTKKKGKALFTHRSQLSFEINDLYFNARELSWNATLYPYDGPQAMAPIRLEGRYDELVEVPVLSRRIRRDEVITLSDLKWHKIDASRLRTDTALKIEQVVGMAPRRTISPNRSVRLAELSRPAVVKKSDRVTLQFISSTMELKTLGEAMQDGAVGDIIRIRNKDSHQPVQARILAPGLAQAMPLGVLAQADQAGGRF